MASTIDMSRDSVTENRDLTMTFDHTRETRYHTVGGGYNSVWDDCLRALSLGYCFGLGFSLLN